MTFTRKLRQGILIAPIKGNGRGEVDALHNVSYGYNADNARIALKSTLLCYRALRLPEAERTTRHMSSTGVDVHGPRRDSTRCQVDAEYDTNLRYTMCRIL